MWNSFHGIPYSGEMLEFEINERMSVMVLVAHISSCIFWISSIATMFSDQTINAIYVTNILFICSMVCTLLSLIYDAYLVRTNQFSNSSLVLVFRGINLFLLCSVGTVGLIFLLFRFLFS